MTGNGMTLADAAVSCLGEAAEAWCQFEQHGSAAKPSPASDGDLHWACRGWIGHVAGPMASCLDWAEGRDAATGRAVHAPADLVWRRPPSARVIQPPAALSTGVAAGPSHEAAAERAILELIERDAAALWWLGGSRPRLLSPSSLAHHAAMSQLAAMRQGHGTRRTQLLDITTDHGVPAVAAASTDQSGRGLAVGIAARLTFKDAACAALREMGQMEMAAAIASAKRTESGDHALNDADKRHLARAAFAASSCGLLEPCGEGAATAASDIREGRSLLQALAPHGLRIILVDLTQRGIDVPVVRAICPDLQPFSETATTIRLAKAWAKSGGGRRLHGGVMPF